MVDPKDQGDKIDYSDDALDDWYSDEEDDGNLDPPAVEAEAEYGDSSPPPEVNAEAPGDEAQESDAAQAPKEAGNSAEAVQDPEDPYPWLKGLDPEARAEAEKVIRRDQSNSGRVAAQQRRLEEAEAALEAQRLAAQTVRPERTSETESSEDLDDPALKEFAEEFPTVYQNMRKMMASDRDAAVRAAREEIRPLKEEQQKEHLLREKETLRRNVERIFNSEETGVHLEDVLQSPAWRDWLDSQPKGYQEFARTSHSSADATKVMEDFARWTEDEIAKMQAADQKANAGPPVPDSEEQVSEADLIAQRRKESLQSATDVASRSANINDRDLADYNAYFDEAVNAGN